MTLPNRFDRQQRIAGWNHERLREARVAVCGRDFAGAFLVWALGSLGVGEILWIGRPIPTTESLARFLLSCPPPCGEGVIHEFPFDPEYGPELELALGGPLPQILAVMTEHPYEQRLACDWARRRRVPALVGSTSSRGWFGASPPPAPCYGPQDPARAMVVAGLTCDAIRELLNPLASGMLPSEGSLELDPPVELRGELRVLQVGVGGIGVYSAVALAAALGRRLFLRLWDFDRVEPTNLNRQGLFTADDACRGTHKAHAARGALGRLFPLARVLSEARRLGPDDASRVASLSPRPSVLVSAVDNGECRLALQRLGQELSIPVIHGGTSIFGADCYTQETSGPTLDDQMHGALTAAADRERRERSPQPRDGGCGGDPSYVVPGLMAGAMLAYRLTRPCRDFGRTPIRWRSGGIPIESRSLSHAGYDLGEIFV